MKNKYIIQNKKCDLEKYFEKYNAILKKFPNDGYGHLLSEIENSLKAITDKNDGDYSLEDLSMALTRLKDSVRILLLLCVNTDLQKH